MLVSKNVMVEDKVDDLMQTMAQTVQAFKAGQTVEQVGLGLLLKMQSLVADVQAAPADYAESFSGTVKAVELAATDIAAALLGKN